VWDPDDNNLEKAKRELSTGVQHSTLPDKIKDQHADQTYNHLKPYNQDIRTFLDSCSFALLLQKLKALSRALRNSDYADVEVRKHTLKNIVKCWEEVSKVIFILTPILVERGRASFEGYGFTLSKDFLEEKDKEKLFLQILCANPHNAVNYVRNELSSGKIAPLIYNLMDSSVNSLQKHFLSIFLIFERPNKWHEKIDKYIADLDKNNFYMSDVLNHLRYIYKYSHLSSVDVSHFKNLIKKCYAKHELGIKNPVGKDLNRVKDSAIPDKAIDEV